MSDYPQLLHTVLDTTTPRELAEFYRELLGLQYRPGDELPTDGTPDEADWLVLVDAVYLNADWAAPFRAAPASRASRGARGDAGV